MNAIAAISSIPSAPLVNSDSNGSAARWNGSESEEVAPSAAEKHRAFAAVLVVHSCAAVVVEGAVATRPPMTLAVAGSSFARE